MQAARMTGMKPTMVYSIITTSMAKMTPAMGVLKEAAIPAAVPQATSTRRLLWGRRSSWPRPLEAAAPRWIAGPSRPADSPPTTDTTPTHHWFNQLRSGKRPW